jgi:hypothetical protein
MSLKTYKTAVCAGALMSAVAWSGGAFASISQNFESDMTGITGTGGSLGAGSVGTIPCGRPGTVGADLKVLAITGTVTYAESDTPSSNASQVDLMFKAEPTDELDDLAGQTDIKVALAVVESETAGKASLKLWCKAKNASTASWVALCDVDNASWARATLVLDYTTERCRVSINGDPQVTANAYADAWYTFANGKGSDNYLKSVTMVGSTEVDDFVVSHSALDSYVEPFDGAAVTADGVVITYEDLNKYGITVAQATENGVLNADSGMKISEKIDAGLNPKSATKFEMKTMTTTSASAATITFPGNKTSGYTVTATSDAAGATVLKTATVTQSVDADANGEKTNTATFSDLPDNELIYFHLKAN